MTAFAYELAVRRAFSDEGTSVEVETVWHVVGATSYANAAQTLTAVLPTTFTYPGNRIAFLSRARATEKRDDEFFEFEVTYKSQPAPAENETEFEFDVSAPTERVFQSIASVAFFPAGRPAPVWGGAIGVADGVPQGAEPLSAFSSFSVTKHWPLAIVNQSLQLSIEAMIGSVASVGFAGRAAGTVRFLGARGRRAGDRFPVSYMFGFRPNLTAFVVDGIIVTAANGWDVLDTFYEWREDVPAKKAVRRPRSVYVHRIHPLVDLNALNLFPPPT